MRLFAAIALLASPCFADDAAKINLLSKDEAAAAIVEEKIEPYFKLMTAIEMAAKVREELPGETLGAKRDECRKRYAAAVKDFTDGEKAVVRAAIERVQPVLKEHYPLWARTPWSVIKKSDALEAGAHFTRESHIVLSEHVLVRAAKFAADGKQDAAVSSLLPLLLHEQTHVHQRLHPKVFADLYVTLWGYKHAAKIAPGDWLGARQVVNPDAVDVNWLMPMKDDEGKARLYWPRIVLTKTQGVPVMFRDMQMVVIEVDAEGDGHRAKLNEDGTPVMQPLADAKAFIAIFPHGNAYHPNEAAAVALPAVILADLHADREAKKTEDRKAYEGKLRKWMREKMR